MEQLVILLIVGGITLAKWLIEKSAEMRERKKTQERIDRLGGDVPEPEPRRRSDPEEAARKFLEALGLPPESAPPERPTIRPVPPIIESPLPRAFAPEPAAEPEPQPPPLVVQADDLERRLVDAKKLAASFKRQTVRKPAAPGETVPAPTRLDALLRTRSGLRQAIIAREILGTPKGLDF